MQNKNKTTAEFVTAVKSDQHKVYCLVFILVVSTYLRCFIFLLLVIGYHLVVLPKHDDQSKAILAACTEKQLIKLAAKEFSKNKGLPGTLPDGRKITVPKILDKAGVYIVNF